MLEGRKTANQVVLDGGGSKVGLEKGTRRAKIAGYCCCLIRKPEQSHGAAVHGLRFLEATGLCAAKTECAKCFAAFGQQNDFKNHY